MHSAPIPSAIKANPFYQAASPLQIRVFVHKDHIEATEEALSDLAFAVSFFEINEATGEWYVEILTEATPAAVNLESRLALMAGLLHIETPRFEMQPLATKNWVLEVEQSFTPLHIGRFYVHGSHVEARAPHGKIALKVNAGAAFGSGEHATTSGCLLALSQLAKRRSFSRLLDMGCGSGILALGAAKLWNRPTIGVDIDPVSIAVARENAEHNKARHLTRFAAGDGYNCNLVRHHAPFDLIVANILARPLMRMASSLEENLAPKGIAVLSGLLATQERMVLSAHHMQGLRLVSRICQSGWNTLILTK